MPSAANKIPTDAILPMRNTPAEPYMDQIISGAKTHEFRKYLIKSSIQRIWFYMSAPTSSLKYICEIEPAATRKEGDAPLPENGLGNKEFNQRHADWHKYDYAYKIVSVYELLHPVTLAEMKEMYGMKGAPQGLQYLPAAVAEAVDWRAQTRLL